MSTLDCNEVFRGPCHCGQGQVSIDRCVPDHGWETQSVTMKTYIQCQSCQSLYSVETQRGNYVFVLKADILSQEHAQQAWSAAARALVQSNEAVNLYSKFASLVNSQPSTAATFRLFEANGLASGTEGTSRRNWQGVGRWIQSNDYFGSKLRTFMKMVNVTDAVLEAGIRNVEGLYAAAHKNLPIASVIISTSKI